MHFLLSIALVLQIISAVVVIVLVLMQHGKGADLGAAFGRPLNSLHPKNRGWLVMPISPPLTKFPGKIFFLC